jgi:hypothetical protein
LAPYFLFAILTVFTIFALLIYCTMITERDKNENLVYYLSAATKDLFKAAIKIISLLLAFL